MKKLTRRQAKRLFDKNKIIYLKPSKITEQIIKYSPWFCWYQAKKEDFIEGMTFEKMAWKYERDNCSDKHGRCVHFYAYVPIDELPQIDGKAI